MYKNGIKRLIDFCFSFLGILVLSPVLLVLTIIGAISMKGNPFFVQERPGKNERIFKLIKFRTMTQEKDQTGKLLPDEKRLTKYGQFLRKTSLDELPEMFNILIGDMAIIGPRPLLIEYLPYYNEREKLRHTVRPGLTGLAQVTGRNSLTWAKRFETDVYYVENLTFALDVRIFFSTIKQVIKRDNIAIDTQKEEGNFAQLRKKELEKK